MSWGHRPWPVIQSTVGVVNLLNEVLPDEENNFFVIQSSEKNPHTHTHTHFLVFFVGGGGEGRS